MADLRVYGWTEEGRHRCIVAAKSRAAVRRAYDCATGLSVSDHHLALYGDWTSNAEELSLALERPGVVFRRALRHGSAWEDVSRG